MTAHFHAWSRVPNVYTLATFPEKRPVLLTITTTQPDATDLGYLLHKNPARLPGFYNELRARMYSTRGHAAALHGGASSSRLKHCANYSRTCTS